jgi:L-rhamnose mutarotase
LEALKHFIYWQAATIDGTKGLEACVETVRNYWNRFTAGWKQKHETIQKDIAESVTNVSVKAYSIWGQKTNPTQYIYGELMKELRLLREKKPRRFANNNHLKAYGKLFWAHDWKEYGKPATRQND